MRYKTLGKSNLKVSVIGMGTWALGGDFFGAADERQAIDAIRAGIDAGINLVDTSPAYGLQCRSEQIVGKALQGYRDRVILATKLGVLRGKDGGYINCLQPESMRNEIDRSLSNLKVDVIDLYQVHWPDGGTPMEQVGTELDKMQKAGKIRYIGVSNFDIRLMDDLSKYCEIVSLQPQYSLLCRGIESDLLPYCRSKEIGVLSYGSLGAGMLTGKFKQPPAMGKRDSSDIRETFYPFLQEENFGKARKLVDAVEAIAKRYGKPASHVAINWVNQQEGVTTALVGFKNQIQVLENAAAGDWMLSQTDVAELNEAWDILYR